MGGLKSGEWDLAFFGPTPERDSVLNFTEPLLVIEHGYLVPAGSPISTIDAVDRPEIRVGAPQGGSVNAFLKRALKNATVVQLTSTHIQPDQGHVHLYLDNQLIYMAYQLAQDVPVHPGVYSLKAEFVAGDHFPFNPRVWSAVVVFTVR